MAILQDLWTKHSYWLIPLAWMILSALLNILFRKKSPEAWVEYGKKYPRLAAIIRMCSALGIDLSKALLAFQKFVNAQADAAPKTPALEAADKVLDTAVDKVAPKAEEEPKETPKETPEAKDAEKKEKVQ